MRSRFRAFRCRDAAWLLASWHPRTRPSEVRFDDDIVWRGLQIVDVVHGEPDDPEDIVEFRATYVRRAGGASSAVSHGVQHERSRFVREHGRWFYLDGDILS